MTFRFVIDRWFPLWPPCTLYRSRSSTNEKRSRTAYARSPPDYRNLVHNRRMNSSLALCLAGDRSCPWSPLRPGFCSFCSSPANQSGRPILSTGASFGYSGLTSWAWGRLRWDFVGLWSVPLVWPFHTSAWVCPRSFQDDKVEKEIVLENLVKGSLNGHWKIYF